MQSVSSTLGSCLRSNLSSCCTQMDGKHPQESAYPVYVPQAEFGAERCQVAAITFLTASAHPPSWRPDSRSMQTQGHQASKCSLPILGLGVSSSHLHHEMTSPPATGAFITGGCSGLQHEASRQQKWRRKGRVLLDAGGERAV